MSMEFGFAEVGPDQLAAIRGAGSDDWFARRLERPVTPSASWTESSKIKQDPFVPMPLPDLDS
jgi:hypothetical protein